ncbi:MAG: FAD-dependent oxidoreductase [Clostridia bacterium]|nr:FAD-dependent oxidoreductase [Clostridia bacterium]
MYDIIIVGAGPAGLTAAVYARRAEKSVLIIEKSTFGGQITFSPKIENYPGFKEIGGNALADVFVDQALGMGAEIELGTVNGIISGENGTKTVYTKEGDTYTAKAVILATGAKHRMLGVEGEAELVGNGISFCAVCDGAFYKNQDVAVIGGGNSALQEAVLLSDTAKSVTLVQNLDYFTGEAGLLETLRKKSNVNYITGTVVYGFEAENGLLSALKLKKVESGEESTLKVDGAFIAIGLAPDNKDFENVAELDQWGYFNSCENCRTATEGIFVAGDARQKKIRQITTATADGAVSALAACEYIDSI